MARREVKTEVELRWEDEDCTEHVETVAARAQVDVDADDMKVVEPDTFRFFGYAQRNAITEALWAQLHRELVAERIERRAKEEARELASFAVDLSRLAATGNA